MIVYYTDKNPDIDARIAIARHQKEFEVYFLYGNGEKTKRIGFEPTFRLAKNLCDMMLEMVKSSKTIL